MPKNTALLLIVWNLALTVLVAWMALRPAGSMPLSDGGEPPARVPLVRDTTALSESRIAYFFMDSLQEGYTMVREQGDRFRSEGRRLESNLQNEMAKAQQRYHALMTKDHTYSTQSEVRADEEELQGLMEKIQKLQASSEQQLARMEVEMLSSISREIEEYLDDYNRDAGFDFIFSVQNGGQIWVGNPDLDITGEVIGGLNARHAKRKQESRK